MSREIKFRAWNKWMKRMEPTREFDAKGYPVMQFTGLRDRNGKEIYEGDILRNNCDMTFPVTVDDLHGYRFMFGVDNLTAYDSKGEVIGNIYENPELLEEK